MRQIMQEIINDLENNDWIALEEKHKNMLSKKSILVSLQKLIDLDYRPNITQNFNGINGLWYIENYLSSNEIEDIKKYIQNDIAMQPITNNSTYSRRVAHFGYYYSYNRTGLKTAPKIPTILNDLAACNRINKLTNSLILEPFDQVIINEYKPNQQITYHTDDIKLFGPVIACITIGQAIPIYFKNENKEIKLDIKEGSMYIMTGDARYSWKHSLKNNKSGIRYSITYRTIVKKK